MHTYIAFGVGQSFFSYVQRLDSICKVTAFSDNNTNLWGQHLIGDERICVAPSTLRNYKNTVVLILSEKESSISAIEKQLDGYGLYHQRVREFLRTKDSTHMQYNWPQLIQRHRIHKFIELMLPGTSACNFHCEYCYVWKTMDVSAKSTITSNYPIHKLRKALSTERLGGPCFINACASGETMLSDDIVELAYELLDEGHYFSIVTNGTISKKIDEILEFPKSYLKRMFFKLSFHYLELRDKNMLAVFWNNVEKIRKSPCSYTLEITPSDTLVPYIDDIKTEFKIHANNAQPHITFTRDGTKKGLDLLSQMTLDEYKSTWKTFHSELFNLKCNLYRRKIDETCYAGDWSYRINVLNGNLQSCHRQALCGTVFDKIDKPLPLLTVCNNCKLNYCFNNHAFIAWGDVPGINCANYFQIRDRKSESGEHWVKEPFAEVMKQKLYDNNFAYADYWEDYAALLQRDDHPALLLFNSPEYSNLGDHAIALAEKKILTRIFPERKLFEVSCEQYIKENLILKKYIRDDDIIFINGGGNIGTLWLWIEDLVKNIISRFPNNRIIIFPQSVCFEENEFGKSELKSFVGICNNHPRLTIMLRERMSYKYMKAALTSDTDVLLMPDMAFSLTEYSGEYSVRNGAIICFRDDKESTGQNVKFITDLFKKRGIKTHAVSTLAKSNVYLSNRIQNVSELIHTFTQAEVVVTDRLHAMIFCAITQTPCVAFDNLSGKISSTYRDWLQETDYITMCENPNDLEICLSKVINSNAEKRNIPEKILEKFDELEIFLRGNI